MKHLLIFIFVLFSFDVFGQDSFIETKYPRNFSFFGQNIIEHSTNSMLLDDAGLRNVFEGNATSLNLLQTARRDKGIGMPLLIVGTAGIVTSILISSGHDHEPNYNGFVFNSSLLVGSIGSLFVQSYTRNRLRAVNSYNQSLYHQLTSGDVEPLLELEYGQNPFILFSYYREGFRLNNKALTSLLGEQEELRELMRKANIQRGIGTGLLVGGMTGALSLVFYDYEQNRTSAIVAGSSLATMITGVILINASRSNRQEAVNIYNKQLFESATGMSRLDINLNPASGGLVLRF